MKRSRLIIALFLLLPVMLLSWLTLTQSGMRWLYQQVEFYLPLELSIASMDGNLIGPITVSGLEYQQDGMLIRADQIILDWQPAELLIAHIDISQLHIRSLEIVLPDTESAEQAQSQPSVTILPEINLPWRLLLKDGLVDGLSISQNGETYAVNRVKLNATTLFSKINIKELAVDADTYSVEIKGSLSPTSNYQHELDISWQTRLPSTAILKGQGQIKGDMEKTRLTQRVQGPLQLSIDAELSDLLDLLSWQAKVDARQFDLAKIDTSWPALSGAIKFEASGDLSTATVAGRLQGKHPEVGDLDAAFNLQRLSDNTIQINQLKLLLPQTDTTIDSSGTWLPAANGGHVDLTMDWKNLRWPMQQPAWFNSNHGNGTITGNIDHYEIDLTTDSPWPQTIASTWHASATGNIDGLDISSLRVEALQGEAIASGQLKWSPELKWTADISASGIDPASLWPEMPGQLKAKISSKGRMQDGQLVVENNIKQITGTLRNYPVTLRSQVNWQNDQLQISRLDFHSGKSQITVDGRIGETLKLDWTVDSPNLAELYPLAKGQLKASGHVSGSQQTPVIQATVHGKALSYPNYEIAAIDGSLAVDLFHWEKVDIKLAAQKLSLNDFKVETLSIDADSQQQQLKVTSKQLAAQVELRGKARAAGWQGQIEQITVQSEYFDNWQLDKPVALDLSDSSITADTLCLHNDRQASICGHVDRQQSAWSASIDMKKLPLKLLHHWLPEELELEGVADGSASVKLLSTIEPNTKSTSQSTSDSSTQPPDQLLAQVHIELPPSAIIYPMLGGKTDRREYSGGNIQLTLDAQALKASAELTMVNKDHLLARLVLPGFNPLSAEPAEQPMKASVQLDILDMRMIESITSEIHELQGEFKLQLIAEGTLDHPLLSGHAELLNGELQIPRLGLNIEKLTLSSRSDNDRTLNFHLDARSGGGKLAVDGHTRLDRADGWPTEISIKGDKFEVSSIPEARVMASPDLKIKLKNRSIDISGNIDIPYAKLQPKDITQAATTSSDTVIIGGEQQPEEKWLITTEVRLTLGDRVHFYGFGFEGRLGGSLLLKDEPGQLTTATGVITIPEGNYRAYGQRLEVENGRIVYTGGPLTNPGLDLRAVRKVSDITVGLTVRGSLNQPQLEIFSSPAMSQTDALAYLILGRPLESANSEEGNTMAKAALALGLSGGDQIARGLGDRFGLDDMRVESSDTGDQASLVVGRYISPKLYASYGVGLIESINTLTLRYQISNKWQIKAESGEAQGADILYTFER
jgi:translocation and assembly module TamB